MDLPGVSCSEHNTVVNGIRISELKARLGELLRSMRKKGTPTDVVEPVVVRRATRRPYDLPLPPPPLATPTDSVAILLDDRRD